MNNNIPLTKNIDLVITELTETLVKLNNLNTKSWNMAQASVTSHDSLERECLNTTSETMQSIQAAISIFENCKNKIK